VKAGNMCVKVECGASSPGTGGRPKYWVRFSPVTENAKIEVVSDSRAEAVTEAIIADFTVRHQT